MTCCFFRGKEMAGTRGDPLVIQVRSWFISIDQQGHWLSCLWAIEHLTHDKFQPPLMGIYWYKQLFTGDCKLKCWGVYSNKLHVLYHLFSYPWREATVRFYPLQTQIRFKAPVVNHYTKRPSQILLSQRLKIFYSLISSILGSILATSCLKIGLEQLCHVLPHA